MTNARWKFVAALGLALSLVVPRQGIAASKCEDPFIARLFHLSCFLEVIHWVEVTFGSGDEKQEEKNGLNKRKLDKLVRLRLRNDLSFLKHETWKRTNTSRLKELGQELKKYGAVNCYVWHVGDDYPIAQYMRCDLGGYYGSEEFSSAYLGYSNKNNVRSVADESIRGIIAQIAIDFLESRDTWRGSKSK